MKATSRSWSRLTGSIVGAALAGPGGAIVGSLTGGLLASVLPDFLGNVAGELTADAVTKAGNALVQRLSQEDKLQINHDLQIAFRDAFQEAICDVGGEACFGEQWRQRRLEVPGNAVYAKTSEGIGLWRAENPRAELAPQVCDCLETLRQAVVAQRVLPLEPPKDQPAADVRLYLEAQTPEDLADLFFAQVVAPHLSGFRSLMLELPRFESHLRSHLLDRTLVHLGELLKERTPAWRAFNRLLLEGVQHEVKRLGAGQTEILERLEALLAGPEAQPLTDWADGMADLLVATGEIEKRLDEGFDAVLGRVVSQHREVLQQFDRLAISTSRIETKVDRVLMSMDQARQGLEAQGAVTEEPPEPGEAPFKGLRYFDEADAGLFFGREQLTAQLVEELREHRLLLVVGASGSGKSSLVRAGLIPALRSGSVLCDGTWPPDGSAAWPVHVITPAAHPLKELAASLTRDSDSVRATATLMDDLTQDARSLDLAVHRVLSHGSADRLLLVVDQFEELFTHCRNEAERKAFVDNLLTAVSPEVAGPTVLVIALRADFYAHCAQYEGLREALERRQRYIGAMSHDELRRAIEEPARHGGWILEPGLVDLMLRDVGDEPGALPLLSHALLETWQRRRGRTLTLKGYAEAGGVHGAIARTAETVFTRQLTPEQQAVARSIFVRLTELGEGTLDTRRRATLDELVFRREDEAIVGQVLQKLVEARLISMGEGTAEVAHEALIREWPTLQAWLDEDREGLRIHRHLTEAAQDWLALGRDPGALFRGARLAAAGEWVERHAGELNQLEQEFLAASQEAIVQEAAEREEQQRREAQLAAQKRSAKRLRRLAVGLGVSVLVACLLALLAAVMWGVTTDERDQAQAQRDLATSLRLAFASVSELQEDRELALLVAIEAGKAERSPEAESALKSSLVSQTTRYKELIGHTGSVYGAEWSPDGSLVLTYGADRGARIWDSMDGDGLAILGNHVLTEDFGFLLVDEAVWSPDGRYILTVNWYGEAYVWSATAAVETEGSATEPLLYVGLRELQTTGPWMTAVWSPSGSQIAVSGVTEFAIWDVEDALADAGGEPKELISGQEGFSDIQWSPDGLWLTLADGEDLYLMDGKDLGDSGDAVSLEGHEDSITAVSWSPDSQWIASAGEDGDLMLWDVDMVWKSDRAEGPSIVLKGHTNRVLGVEWSPDGSQILTYSADGTARVWDLYSALESGVALRSLLTGHGGQIRTAVWNPDGTRILTTGTDNTARIWDIRVATQTIGEGAEQAVLIGHEGALYGAAWSPNGDRVVTTSADRTARIWEVVSGAIWANLVGHEDTVGTAEWSPDGNYIATAGWDDILIVWDTTSAARLATLRGHTDDVWGAFWNPDGTLIASFSSDKTARLWDIAAAITAEPESAATAVLRGHTDGVAYGAWSPDGSWLATAGLDGTIRLWDVGIAANSGGEGAERALLTGHEGGVEIVEWSPDGRRLATGSDDHTLRIWDVETAVRSRGPGAEVAVCSGHQDVVNAVEWSPDGSMIATTSDDGTARLWDAAAAEGTGGGVGAEIATLEGHSAPVFSVEWSPDGRIIATTSTDQSIRLWDVSTAARTGGQGSQQAVLSGHQNRVYGQAWSSDGKYIATVSQDGTARLWDVATAVATGGEGAQVALLRGAGPPGWRISWSPNGDRILTAGGDSTVDIFKSPLEYAPPEDVWEMACWRVSRNMSEEEWRQYMGDEPYRPTCPNLPWPWDEDQ